MLVGVQVPRTEEDGKALENFLGGLKEDGFKYKEETENPVYKDFLL